MPLEILVVDDEPDLALLIRQKFRKRIRSQEWEFHFAQNGYEALEALEIHKNVKLVLTDINMPEMDGLTLLDHLSKPDRLLKAIVVSAYGDMSNIRTAMNRGAFDFVTKPVDFDDLEITIEKTLREVIAYQDAVHSKLQLSALQKELAVARRIQEAFIPANALKSDAFDIEAHIDMAHEVGGDFYDFFMPDTDRLALVIGDVSGKGISAALFMAMTRTLIRAIGLKGEGPGACLEDVNALLYPQSLPEVFVTVFYGLLDLESGVFTYSTAGHFPPYRVKSSGGSEALPKTEGIGLCMLPAFSYREAEVQLSPHDRIFLFTDGLTEATRHDKEQFALERLEPVLQAVAREGEHSVIESVLNALNAYTEGAPQYDDITMLSLAYKGC